MWAMPAASTRHAILAVLLLGCATSVRAQAPADPALYREAVRIYLATGDSGIAVERLIGWDPAALQRAAYELTRIGDVRLMEAGALLHLELGAAIAGWSPASAQRQFELGERLVDALLPGNPDVRRTLDPKRTDEIATIRATWLGVAGSVFLSVHDVFHARSYFVKALKIKPRSAPILTLLGTADEIDGANHDPNEMAVRLRKRVEVERKRLLASAEDHYRRALETDPRYPLAQIRRGRVDFLRGNFRQAGEWLRQGSAAASTPAERYLAAMFTGALLQAQQDVAGARASFETALAIAPKSQSAVVALAHAELMAGRPDRSHALARRYADAVHDSETWWTFSGTLDQNGLQWLRRRLRP